MGDTSRTGVGDRSRGKASWIGSFLILLLLPLLVLAAACSERNRYRTLSFFFDGVPDPWAETATESDPAGGEDELRPQDDLQARRPRLPQQYLHTPYRERRCRGCHESLSARLAVTIEDGLCRECHAGFAQDKRFVHGPVAVVACAECHHFHRSLIPGVLLREPDELCLRCHPTGDLLAGEHHSDFADGEDLNCVSCHDPHGGDDRFFLKPEAR